MKAFSQIMKQLKEDDDIEAGEEMGEETVSLADVLDQLEESYLEENPDDEDLEDYDTGLLLLREFADEIPEEVAASMVEELKEIFELGESLVEFKKTSAAVRKSDNKADRMYYKKNKRHIAMMRKRRKNKRKDPAKVKLGKKVAAAYN